MIIILLPVCGAAFQQKGSAPAGRPGVCSPLTNGRELLHGGNGPLGFAGESWCLLAATAPTPLNLARGRRGRNGTCLSKSCVPTSVTSQGKLLCCTLDHTGKTTAFSNWLSITGKKLPSTNKLLQHCLLFHFSWHFPLIQLGLAPVENRRLGTTSSSELAIPASLLLG